MPRVALFAGVAARAWGFAGRALLTFSVIATPAAANASASPGSGAVTNSVTVSQSSGPTSTLYPTWTYRSGDTSISCTSPSSLTTTFSGTAPSSEFSSKSAIWRCTVTNDFAQSDYVDVSVTISSTLGGISVVMSPNSGEYYHASGTPFSLGFSVSASGGSGGYTFTWSPTDNFSPTTGSSSTFTVPSNPPGSRTGHPVAVGGQDSIGRTGSDNGFIYINWT